MARSPKAPKMRGVKDRKPQRRRYVRQKFSHETDRATLMRWIEKEEGLMDGNKRKKASRADLEERAEKIREGIAELGERGRRLDRQIMGQLERQCEDTFVRMCERGEVNDYAREHGLSHRDALERCYEEAVRPLVEARQESRELAEHHARRRLAAELGQDPKEVVRPKVDPADEALDRKVRERAARLDLDYREALELVLEDAREAHISSPFSPPAGAEGIELSTTAADQRPEPTIDLADEALDKKIWAYAGKHGVGYREAFAVVTRGGA